MAKTKSSVTVSIPQPGAEARSGGLALDGATAVVLSVPALTLAPGRAVHVNLQAEREGAWYGVPGTGRRGGNGVAIEEKIALPEGTKAVRVCLFSELEAAKELSGEVKLAIA